MRRGRIIKIISGVYTVKLFDGGEVATKPRGVFRKKKITPLVGDIVKVALSDDQNEENIIVEVEQRKNTLYRPNVSNVDVALIVTSVDLPQFSTFLLDKFLVQVEMLGIHPIIYVTKTDLLDAHEKEKIYSYQQDYEKIGYDFFIPTSPGQIRESWKKIFNNQLVVLMGQSGAGKSTLLNYLNQDLAIKTNQASKSLGRGRHTTRHVELFTLYGGLLADTPGFSSLEIEDITKEELSQYYPEIWEHRAYCKFSGCLHDQEPKCAVKNAVEAGTIPSYRYRSYKNLLDEIRNRKIKY